MATKVQTRSGKVHFGHATGYGRVMTGYGRVMTDCGNRNQHQIGQAAADDAALTCASCLRSMARRAATSAR